MFAIYKREMRSYLTSPIGYAFIAAFIVLNAIAFVFLTLYMGSLDMLSIYFYAVIVLMALTIPVLTMKTLSEERRARTEQLLLTSPVSLLGIVTGKFLAAYTMFIGTFAIGSALNFIPLYMYSSPNTAMVIAYCVAIAFIGAAFCAIGVFVSALTENQIVAVFGAVGLTVFFMLPNLINMVIDTYELRVAFSWLSILGRFQNFGYGILDIASLLYFASICFIFMFLTVRIYEKRRWS